MDHSTELWEMSGNIVYCVGKPQKEGVVICELSEPRPGRYIEHRQLELGSRAMEEARSRGQLITAAPKLLRACIEARDYLPTGAQWSRSKASWLRAELENAISSAMREE